MKIFGNNSQLTDLTSFCTIERLSNIKFDNVDILKIPKNLGINKVNGDDNLSIRIIKLCKCKPSELIF